MGLVASYRLFASSLEQARSRAQDIALEQTVEVPADVVPDGFVADRIVAEILEVEQESDATCRLRLRFSEESCGATILQLVNLVFGNTSLQQGVKVTGIELEEDFQKLFPGARFGVEGVRELAGRAAGGLICPVLKPLGLSADQLAELAGKMVRAGADIVKEDHGLADQPCAPFRQRVEKTARAVAKARNETGGKALYFPHLAGPRQELERNAFFAKEAGADGLLVIPGLAGFDLVHRLSSDPAFGLPLMTHPSFLGPHVLSPDTGYTHAVMFGTLQRIAGSDISVFPNVGGRFGFTADECKSIADACRDESGPGLPIMPSPGGGMSVERAPDMAAMYGEDVVYLLGGSLLRAGDRLGEAVAKMRGLI